MPPPPAELPDDLLGEAFLRLPPDDPACLLRTSLACKRWRRVIADPAFRRRHRERHRTPSVLGFLRIAEGATNPPHSGRPAARDLPGREVLDCRHGRVLFRAPSPLLGANLNYDLVVWDPLTNEQRCLPRLSPPLTEVSGPFFNAAVLCSAAVEGCDHTMCRGGPFRVAFIWDHSTGWLHNQAMSARVYSSETDNWSEAISIPKPHQRSCLRMLRCRNTLVGDTLYFHYTSEYALEYQLGAQRLSIIVGPPRPVSRRFLVMPMGDGEVGCMVVEEDESSLCLQLWSREAASGSDGVERWATDRAIDLEELLPNGALPSPRLASGPHSTFRSLYLRGFVEGTDVIFVGTSAFNHPRAVYMVQFNSGRAMKVFDKCSLVFPYTSFCIPVIDVSSKTEGPGDNASVTDASFTTEGLGDNASGA